MHTRFHSDAATFRPTSSPFRPVTPVKSGGYASGLPTPTRAQRHASVEYANSRKKLFEIYANDSQHIPTVKPTSSEAGGPGEMYNNANSFPTDSFNYQHGFGPSSGSSMASTGEYSGSSMADTSLFSAVSMPQRSTSYSPPSPPMVADNSQVPFSAIEKPRAQYQHYLVSEDDWHYRHPESAPFSNQPQHKQNHAVETSAYFLEGSNYSLEQKQRSLSEGMEEDHSWKSAIQRPQYAQRQQNYVSQQQRNSFQKPQVSHGEEKTSSDFTTWRRENTIDRRHASTSVSFLKQHDEKPVQALIAWERYSAARKP